MTSADPKRKRPEMLKDDSCLKFKMKECIMTGKTDEYDSGALDSPSIKKSVGGAPLSHKESRFANNTKLFAQNSQEN